MNEKVKKFFKGIGIFLGFLVASIGGYLLGRPYRDSDSGTLRGIRDNIERERAELERERKLIATERGIIITERTALERERGLIEREKELNKRSRDILQELKRRQLD